ncbi:MAG: adenylate/guanylate cyclase domain-containing protein [Pseudomonadota bacterium]
MATEHRGLDKLERFLDRAGLTALGPLLREQDVDFDVLPSLDDDDLRELGLSLGHRKRLLRAIASLRTTAPNEAAGTADTVAPSAREAGDPPPAPEAERRQMTILFCDMVGSTGLASKLDTEDLFALVGAFQRRCTEVVRAHGGHVAQYLGDGILAYFGFPRANEDDAERAVAAGLELVGAVQTLRSPSDVSLHARVGIDTGFVVIGELLSGSQDEDSAVGDTPNRAARLQSIAPVNGVMISDTTRALVGKLFELTDAGQHELKGFAAPLQVWRAIGEGASDSRFEARVGVDLDEPIGRDQELQLMLERWRLASDGEGQMVLLSGEGGIGKSRLVHALTKATDGTPHARLRYSCAQFHAQTSLFPITEQIKRMAGFGRDDPPGLRLDKLDALLRSTDDEPETMGPLLATLCSVTADDRYPESKLSPPERKTLTFKLLVRQIEHLARRQPLLIQFEDVHWIDPMTNEFLGLLVERLRELPVLVVMTCRPEFRPPWPLPAHATLLRLNRFARSQSGQLIERLAGGVPLPAAVHDRILQSSDGIPLFVEELTKAMLESGALERTADGWVIVGDLPTIRIPSTLHDSLMARLDRLGDARQVALWASALGRNFTLELLLAVAPFPRRQLEAAVERLLEAGMLHRHGPDPDDPLEFKHALVQAAAYESLLRQRRQQMHARIADVLEGKFPELATTRPETLAHHLALAGEAERAFDYALRAGDQAARHYASPEAHQRYGEALVLARSLPPGERAARREIRAILKCASVAVGHEQVEVDLTELAKATILAERHGLEWRGAQALYWTGRLNYVAGRFSLAADFARQSLALADETNNLQLGAAGANLLARIHCLRGEPLAGIAYASRNVDEMRRLGDSAEEGAINGVLGFALALAGRFDEALAATEAGVEISNELDHVPTRAACHFFKGVVLGWRGDLAAATVAFDRALELANEAGDVFRRYLILGWLGEALLHAGRTSEAAHKLETALALGASIGSTFHRAAYMALLGEALLVDPNDADRALRLTAEALDLAERGDENWSRAIALRARASAIASGPHGATEDALPLLDDATQLLEKLGVATDLFWTFRARAAALARLGREAHAADAVARADQLSRTMAIVAPAA